MAPTYRERPSLVPGAIVWTATTVAGEKRVLPDGCMDLIWNGHDVTIAGPDTHAHLFTSDGTRAITGLRFAPGYAPRVLAHPAHAFIDQQVPLDAVWSRVRVDRLVDQLLASREPGRVLERESLRVATTADPDARRMERVTALAARGETVSSIASAVGWSARHLQRQCRDAYGYGAKTLERILRLWRALDLAYDGTGLAVAAARAGYADQSHLAREVKDLAGVPLGQLVAEGSTANNSTALPSGSWTAA